MPDDDQENRYFGDDKENRYFDDSITAEAIQAVDVESLIEKADLERVEWAALQAAGKEKWNAWVERHPEADVDLGYINFAALIKAGSISFREFRFPKGTIKFFRSRFGEGEVDFSLAEFSESDVYFNKTEFCGGDVKFRFTHFHEGSVTFNKAHFGDCRIDFASVKFSECDVDFTDAILGKGDVNFTGARFSGRHFNFDRTIFGEGTVFFNAVHISRGDVSFAGSTIKGDIAFTAMRMGLGNFIFLPKQPTSIGQVIFRYAAIEGTLVLGNLHLKSALDLRNTKLGHPVDFHAVTIAFRKRPNNRFCIVAESSEDSACFRHLKKLAKENNDHARALEFFAQEIRSDYWHGIKDFRLELYMLYDLFSNFGRSLFRPFVALGICTFLFAGIYKGIARGMGEFRHAFEYSLGNALPFYSSSRTAEAEGKAALFGDTLPAWLSTVAITQSVLSSIFLFLIALAVRNIFRS